MMTTDALEINMLTRRNAAERRILVICFFTACRHGFARRPSAGCFLGALVAATLSYGWQAIFAGDGFVAALLAPPV
jgi:hypothetical protein